MCMDECSMRLVSCIGDVKTHIFIADLVQIAPGGGARHSGKSVDRKISKWQKKRSTGGTKVILCNGFNPLLAYPIKL